MIMKQIYGMKLWHIFSEYLVLEVYYVHDDIIINVIIKDYEAIFPQTLCSVFILYCSLQATF